MSEDPERDLTPEEDARDPARCSPRPVRSEQVPDDVAARLDSRPGRPRGRPGRRAGRRARPTSTTQPASRPRWRSGRIVLAAAVACRCDQPGGGRTCHSCATDSRAAAGPATRRRARPRASPVPGPTQPSLGTRGPDLRAEHGHVPARRTPAAGRQRRQPPAGAVVRDRAAAPATSSRSGALPRVAGAREWSAAARCCSTGSSALLEVFGVRDGARVVRAVSVTASRPWPALGSPPTDQRDARWRHARGMRGA